MSGKILVADNSKAYIGHIERRYEGLTIGMQSFAAARYFVISSRNSLGLIVTDLASNSKGDIDINRWLEGVRGGNTYIPIIARTSLNYESSIAIAQQYGLDALFKRRDPSEELYICIDELLRNPEAYRGNILNKFPLHQDSIPDFDQRQIKRRQRRKWRHRKHNAFSRK